MGSKNLCEVVFESDSKLKEIGRDAFDGCQIKVIEIPSECEVLHGQTLTKVNFVTGSSRENVFFESEDGFLHNVNKQSLVGYYGKSNRVLVDNCTVKICDECFYGCSSICEVIFSSNSKIKEIGDGCFFRSGLKSIGIPKERPFSIEIVRRLLQREGEFLPGCDMAAFNSYRDVVLRATKLLDNEQDLLNVLNVPEATVGDVHSEVTEVVRD
jgi:hypothetical protein